MALSAFIKVIYMVYIFLRIFKERESRENMYNAKMYTFAVNVTVVLIIIFFYILLSASKTEMHLFECGARGAVV